MTRNPYPKCPSCGTTTINAAGIGPFCPNDECDRLDDLRPGDDFTLMSIKSTPTRADLEDRIQELEDQIKPIVICQEVMDLLELTIKNLKRDNARLRFMLNLENTACGTCPVRVS